MLYGRAYGVFAPVASLPSPYGVGDFGPGAYQFIDFLEGAGASYWQVLPLVPTSEAYGNSPYASDSSFALNPLLVSPDLLVLEGLVPKHVADQYVVPATGRIAYGRAYKAKEAILQVAYKHFNSRRREYQYYLEEFVAKNSYWLRDYALFRVLKKLHGSPWTRWPKELRLRDPKALSRVEEEYKSHVDFIVFEQFILQRQWGKLKKEANKNNISIVGDIPYYVVHDSSDVWAHQELFKLDEKGEPLYVGGVPPDYFSPTGQLWGTPVYDWEKHREQRFQWWINRLRRSLELYDLVRLDHFRGFVAYWEVPAGSPTAIPGKWVKTPYEDFFRVLVSAFPSMPFIAEDLGFITPDVREVMARYGLPSMRVLVFAFNGSPTNEHLPHNIGENTAIYTSTHDTNTVKGWFLEEASPKQRKYVSKYVGYRVDESNVCEVFTRLALSSRARLAMIPVQDILCLGSEGRINRPGTARGNWKWRLLPGQLDKRYSAWIYGLARMYARTPN